MTIHEARPVARRLSLDGEGLAVVEHRSAVKDFYDENELRRVYYPEAERSSRRLPAPIWCWYSMTRSVAAFGAGWIGHRELLGPQRVRDLAGEEADERHRFGIVNVWRPIRGPLRDAPLAACDATSVAFTDFIASDLVYRDRTDETYRVRYNPAHRCFYVPEMRVDEAILIKCYDSAADKARFHRLLRIRGPHRSA